MLNLAYNPVDELEMGWNVRHVNDLNNIEVLHRSLEIEWIDSLQTINKPEFTVHDIFVQWRPFGPESLTLGLAVQNLFNETYRDHASVGDYSAIPGWETVRGLYEPGRDIRANISYQF